MNKINRCVDKQNWALFVVKSFIFLGLLRLSSKVVDDICKTYSMNIVDCSVGWATPWGISVTDETLQRSEAAHRTPPGKRPVVGTEINLTLWWEPLIEDFLKI